MNETKLKKLKQQLMVAINRAEEELSKLKIAIEKEQWDEAIDIAMNANAESSNAFDHVITIWTKKDEEKLVAEIVSTKSIQLEETEQKNTSL
jgi:mRNA-degrading endonuclease HigB of HigAB toxin-antitoxin module